MNFLKEFPKQRVDSDDKLLLSETETTQITTKRRKVNIWAFLVFGVFVLVSLSLIVYTLHRSDIDRLASNFNTEFSNFICTLIMASFLPFVLTLLLAVGFRYAPFFTVVGILVTSWGCLVAASFFFFVRYNFYETIVIPVIFAVLAVIMLCLMVYAKDRIRMTIILFKESAKAVSNIQMLPSVPIMTLHMVIIVVVISGIIHMYMSTTVILDDTGYTLTNYVPNGFMIAAIVLNAVLTVWIVQVMLGLQNMALSSAVSKWYSSRNPVATDYSTTLKNRLESALMGSLVINLVSVPRSILIGLSQISIIKDMVDSFLRYLNGFHYSYIFTASKGSSFFKSSKKARQLLNLNVGYTTGVKYVGSFVMFLCQILVSWASVLFYCGAIEGSYYYNYKFNYAISSHYFVVIISFLFCYTLLAPIQVAYDTLFMCVCEDILKEGHQHNSMSIEEFHSNAAEVLEKKIKETSQLKTTLNPAVV